MQINQPLDFSDGPASFLPDLSDRESAEEDIPCEFMCIGDKESSHPVFIWLRQCCDLVFFDKQHCPEVAVQNRRRFFLFAFNSAGDLFGTVGQNGNLFGDYAAVGMIQKSGAKFVITQSYWEFITLNLSFPLWWHDLQSGIYRQTCPDSADYCAMLEYFSARHSIHTDTEAFEKLIRLYGEKRGF